MSRTSVKPSNYNLSGSYTPISKAGDESRNMRFNSGADSKNVTFTKVVGTPLSPNNLFRSELFTAETKQSRNTISSIQPPSHTAITPTLNITKGKN